MRYIPSDAEWTQSRVATLPLRWAAPLLDQWHVTQATDYFRANVELRDTTEALLSLRIPLDATDADLCAAAEELARRCFDRATLFHSAQDVRASMGRLCAAQGIEPPHEKVKDKCAIARMTCAQWWRRKLRKHHGRTLEAAAICLGRVSKIRDLYVTNEGLEMRLHQNARNKAALEATIARNELGQEFTLAELAATGTSNKKIRRAELMTRIAGFERVAIHQQHAGMFLTITCPSRFHRFRTVNGGKFVLDNPNYDLRENPGTAQKYLAKVWSRIRAKLKRRGLGVYGFRIAEPQHDGTPHWHLLLFYAADRAGEFESIVREHALKDSPDEPGAQEHRCDFKPIDWNKGSAAGYVAKYVSKNIDGAHVGEDLNGKPALETALRVEAWAARWRIRQFQQIGGPPVGVWRELRRIQSIPEGAPQHMRDAHSAANKQNCRGDDDHPSVSWDRYCEAQGGVFCGRDYLVKLAMAPQEGLGHYGDALADKVIGVQTETLELYSPAGNSTAQAERRVLWIAESVRREWQIVRTTAAATIRSLGAKPGVDQFNLRGEGGLPEALAVEVGYAREHEAEANQQGWLLVAHPRFFAEAARPISPWTGVNNCTNTSAEIQAHMNQPPAAAVRDLQKEWGDFAAQSGHDVLANGVHAKARTCLPRVGCGPIGKSAAGGAG